MQQMYGKFEGFPMDIVHCLGGSSITGASSPNKVSWGKGGKIDKSH